MMMMMMMMTMNMIDTKLSTVSGYSSLLLALEAERGTILGALGVSGIGQHAYVRKCPGDHLICQTHQLDRVSIRRRYTTG